MTKFFEHDVLRVVRYVSLALLLLGAPFFFWGGPDGISSPLYKAIWSLGHLLFFAIFAVWLQTYWPMRRPAHWFWLTLGVVVASVAIELIQSTIGRDGNWQDGTRNVIGIWLGLFWFQSARPLVWVGRLLATALLLWQLWPVAQTALTTQHWAAQFPVLSDFESERDLHGWSGDIERISEPVSQGQYSLKVRLGTERYSGVTLLPLQRDWREYDYLSFAVFNPGSDLLSITLRINDHFHEKTGNEFHDRFNHRLQVESGWNHYRVSLAQVSEAPEGRSMELAQIKRLMIFAVELPQERVIYLDHMRLE